MDQSETLSATMGMETAVAQPASWAKPWNVYRDVFGAWRWEMMEAAGEIWDSPGSFDSYNECLVAVKREIRRIGAAKDIHHLTAGVRKELHGHQKAHHAP